MTLSKNQLALGVAATLASFAMAPQAFAVSKDQVAEVKTEMLEAKMQQMETRPSFRIVKNDAAEQAVVSADQKWAGVAFYQAGQSDVFGGIETDQPCVVMLKAEKNGLSVSVSDPTQKLAQVKLTLKGNFQSENSNDSLASSQGGTTWTVKLPKGEEAGKSVSVVLVKKK